MAKMNEPFEESHLFQQILEINPLSADDTTNAIHGNVDEQSQDDRKIVVPLLYKESDYPFVNVVNHYPRATFLSLYSQFQNQKLNFPIHYPNLFAISLNSHDPNQVMEFFFRTCTPDVKIYRNEYSLTNFSKKGKKLKTKEFNKEQYVDHYNNIITSLPDSIFSVHSYRVCYEHECSVFICMAKAEATILPNKPFPSTQEYKTLTYEGSFVFYRNQLGKIFRLDYYLQQLQLKKSSMIYLLHERMLSLKLLCV